LNPKGKVVCLPDRSIECLPAGVAGWSQSAGFTGRRRRRGRHRRRMPAASLMPAVAEAGTVAERVTRAEGFGHAMTRRKVTRATKTEGRFSSVRLSSSA
jgi:hypothetical protein